MMKKALVSALLLVVGSVLLGATVLQEPLAQAAAPIASVFVTNDASTPVPVREQNLDANRNIKVHEQGTADVNVTNSSLPMAPPQPITGGGGSVTLATCPDDHFPGTITASAFRISWSSSIDGVILRRGNSVVATFVGPVAGDESPVDLALTRPVEFDRISCFGTGGISLSWVGNNP
jgi:hypothetical protein